MACLLLVDSNEVARRAMQGILARSGHRLAVVTTPQDAWKFVTTHVRVDLVVTELRLADGSALPFIQQLKNSPFLKLLPVVVYTEHSDRDAIKQALALRVQNILLKPYLDEAIHQEIAKTDTNPWRKRLFADEQTICRQMGYRPEELGPLLQRLGTQLVTGALALDQAAQNRSLGAVEDQLHAFTADAEAAGAWGIVDYLKELRHLAETENWTTFRAKLDACTLADAIISQHLNPLVLPEPFQTRHEEMNLVEEQDRIRWSTAAVEGRCPVVDQAQLFTEVEALAGCPAVESSIAAYQMTVNGQAATVNALMDVVARDPGLATQVLIMANQLKTKHDFEAAPIEDPRLAVGRLGGLRLAELSKNLLSIEDRHLNIPPHFSWSLYWIFLMGVGRVARFTCQYLELHTLELQARMGGLLHDIGKLILAKLHPYGFQATLAHAREHRVPLSHAERLFLGCTSHELGAHFGTKHNLPPAYIAVMQFIDRPEDATEHRELVAIVALARDLCRQYHLGFGGDTQFKDSPPLAETPEWRVLRESVFPSFDLKKFERQAHAYCHEIKHELRGHFKR